MTARSDCLNDLAPLFGGGLGAAFAPAFRTSPWVAGRASSWQANQPSTWMEFLASDLPLPIAAQVLLLLALAALLVRGLVAAAGHTRRCGFPNLPSVEGKRHHQKS
jgi:hypothetical protein